MSFASFVYVSLLALLAVAQWQVGNRHPWAWLLCIVSRLGLIVFAAWSGAVALAPVSATFIVIDWRNYRRWRHERALSDKLARYIEEDED